MNDLEGDDLSKITHKFNPLTKLYFSAKHLTQKLKDSVPLGMVQEFRLCFNMLILDLF